MPNVPYFDIYIGGKSIDDYGIRQIIDSVEVKQSNIKLNLLSFVLDVSSGIDIDFDKIFPYGIDVAAYMGYLDNLTGKEKVFSGMCKGFNTVFEDGLKVTVECFDWMMILDFDEKERQAHGKTLRDIVNEVIKDYSKYIYKTDIDDPDFVFEGYLSKGAGKTDREYLKELADRVDRLVWLEDGVLYFKKPKKDRNIPIVVWKPSDEDKNRENIVLARRFTPRSSLKNLATDMRIISARAKKSETKVVKYRTSYGGYYPIVTERSGIIPGGEIQSWTILADVAGDIEKVIVDNTAKDEWEAKKRAEEKLKKLNKKFVRGECELVQGDNRFKVGHEVDIICRDFGYFARMFSGRYEVVDVTHTYNTDEGFDTRFNVERSFIVAARENFPVKKKLKAEVGRDKRVSYKYGWEYSPSRS